MHSNFVGFNVSKTMFKSGAPYSMTMLKSGARYLVSSFLTGKNGISLLEGKLTSLTGINKTINSFSANTLYIRRLTNVPRSFKRPLQSLSERDDDFSELGSPVAPRVYTYPKLMTEKPERYRAGLQVPTGLCKNDSKGKASSITYLPAESGDSWNDTTLKLSTQNKLESTNNSFTSKSNNKNARNLKASRSITIENVPRSITISQLEKTLSIFGKISNTSMRMKEKGIRCCDVEFESSKSSKRAISVGNITIKSFNLPIGPPNIQETCMIRICRIASETVDSTINSICSSYGPLEGLLRTKEDEVYASFITNNSSEIQKILKKLNYTIIDQCKWSAHLQTNDSEVTTTNNGVSECKLKEWKSSPFDDLKRELTLRKIYMEDFENLHNSLLHLEGYTPTAYIVK